MKYDSERGSAIWFILLAIALMAALTFTLSNSSDRTEDTGNIEQARIKASNIMKYAKGVESAVSKMRIYGIAENDISFEDPDLAGYANANCTNDDCMVFGAQGGNLKYMEPGLTMNDGSDWVITGANDVAGVGTAEADLVMILPNISDAVCTQVNQMLSVTPGGTDNDIDVTPYTGAFTATPKDIANMGGAKAGCQDNAGATYNKFYYQVLIQR